MIAVSALAPGILSTRIDDLLADPTIDIVIELIGGYEPARTFVLRAIASGKHVVTANKALLRRARRRDLCRGSAAWGRCHV